MKFLPFKLILMLVSSLLVSACGGGSGGEEASADTSTSENTTYSLFDITNPPASKVFNMSGDLDNSITFSGTISLTKGGATTYNGQSVIQTNVIINFSTNTGYTFNSSSIIYVNPATRVPVFSSIPADGVQCFVQTENALPLTAKPGASGDLSSYTCSDGSTEAGSWQLVASTNGQAKLILRFTYRDSLGALEALEEDTLTLDASGNVVSFTLNIVFSDGTTFNLTGS